MAKKVYKNNVQKKNSYTTYEFKVDIDYVGECIMLANVVKDDNKDLLELSIKTADNAGFTHFAVGFYIKDVSEAGIMEEIQRLVDYNYFDDILSLALEDEEILEEYYSNKLDVQPMAKRTYENNENYVQNLGGNLASLPFDMINIIQQIRVNTGITKFDLVEETIVEALENGDDILKIGACISSIGQVVKVLKNEFKGCNCSKCDTFTKNSCYVRCFIDRYEDKEGGN